MPWNDTPAPSVERAKRLPGLLSRSRRGKPRLGIDHDTAEFAVNAHGRLRRLQWSAGATVEARVAEAGRRDRPDDLSLPRSARHRNKIEHRLFCHITQNWRGCPLSSHAAVVDLIAATTTTA